MISQDFWNSCVNAIKLSSLAKPCNGACSQVQSSLEIRFKTFGEINEAKIESIIASEIGDIRDQDKLHKSMTTFNPDIALHISNYYIDTSPSEGFELTTSVP
jgi:hypothetical protein